MLIAVVSVSNIGAKSSAEEKLRLSHLAMSRIE